MSGWDRAVQGGMGSLRPASPQDCQVACEMAQPACTSFSYNAVLAACFLKRGGGRVTCVSPTTACTEQAWLLPLHSPMPVLPRKTGDLRLAHHSLHGAGTADPSAQLHTPLMPVGATAAVPHKSQWPCLPKSKHTQAWSLVCALHACLRIP